MTDLFASTEASFAEVFEERAAIMEHDGGLPKETAETLARATAERYRHQCEVRSVVKMYADKGGGAVKEFLEQVAKHRGQVAADKLREDALAIVRAGK